MTETSLKPESIAQEFKEYAYSVSHDLSSPARAMTQFSRLLTEEHADALNDTGKEYLALIIENGEKLQKMMDGLLDYSRLNTMAKPLTVLDCNEIAQNCLTVLNENYSISGSIININTLPTIKADVDQMFQLFMILFDNALKFQPEGQQPELSVSAESEDDHWKFTLKDNGIGIAPAFHQRIFKLFQRLHTDDEYPGVGIGLTLAEKIVHRHGGKIWCESEPGKGSTFHFTILGDHSSSKK